MAKRRITKEHVIETAAELFRTRGYHQTSIGAIAEACHVQKATVFHHVSSREALLVCVAEYEYREFSRDVLSCSSLLAFAEATRLYFASRHYSCLFSQLGQELRNSSVAFKQQAEAFLQSWIHSLSVFLSSKKTDSRGIIAAEDCVARCKGALTIARSYNNLQPFERAIEHMRGLVTPCEERKT